MNNNVRTAGLLGLLGGLFIAAGFALGGQAGAIGALGFAVLFNFAMYFFSDKIALKSSRAQKLEPGQLPVIEQMVASLAQRQDMPMPGLYFIESPQPNAFATGRNPKHAAVAVTRGILDLMTPEELEGVLAHELSHVKNRDILISTIAATIAAALSFLTRMAFWGGRGRDNPLGAIGGIIAIIVAPMAAMVIQMAISRSREYQADRSGAEMTGQPMALASALAKLERGTSQHPMDVNQAVAQLYIADPLKANFGRGGRGGGMRKMFSTHPPIPERIKRLENLQSNIR